MPSARQSSYRPRHRARSTTPESRTFTNTGRRVTPGYTGQRRAVETASSDTTSTPTPSRRQSRPISEYSPVKAGDKAGGVGLLEAEFLGSLLLLVLLLFADLNRSYSDKIMQTMKRGTLICLLFFILSLMAGVGPSMAKVSKAIGAMVFIGILITSPVLDLMGNLDKFFKADWSGTTESGSASSTPSSDGTTPSTTTPAAPSFEQRVGDAINKINDILKLPGFGMIK